MHLFLLIENPLVKLQGSFSGPGVGCSRGGGGGTLGNCKDSGREDWGKLREHSGREDWGTLGNIRETPPLGPPR